MNEEDRVIETAAAEGAPQPADAAQQRDRAAQGLCEPSPLPLRAGPQLRRRRFAQSFHASFRHKKRLRKNCQLRLVFPEAF